MLLTDLVASATEIAATRSRAAKADTIAGLLRAAGPDEAAVVAALIAGDPRQGRIGVGWATVAGAEATPAESSSLTVADLDSLFDTIAAETGEGSTGRRNDLLRDFLGRATAAESDFVRRLLLGELRQGASEGLVVDGLARAAEVPATAVRRALTPTARMWLFRVSSPHTPSRWGGTHP